MSYTNIEDRRANQRKWYNNHRQKRMDEVCERRKELRKWVSKYKENKGCCICRETDGRCLDLHHKNPEEKDYTISKMIHSGCSKENLAKELNKCEVICANCHRKIHREKI